MIARRRLLAQVYPLFLLLLSMARLALAQPEAYNWQFGERAGIRFPAGGGPATTFAPGPMVADEACASLSDGDGVLQCYANGEQVWDRNGTPMPNGRLTGSHVSASQGALLVRGPGQQSRYYLFTVDADENELRGGLRQSMVDMRLRAGLGDVLASNSQPVPIPGGGLVTEKLTAVRHANGRDYWIVVHGWQSNAFYSYLLGPNGLAAAPVVSAVGMVHGSAGIGGRQNAIGYLRASPNGLLLAAAQLFEGVDVLQFDPATGAVSNPRNTPPLRFSTVHYGLEFSPDNTKLYISDALQVHQLDLDNQVRTLLPIPRGGASGLQRGPDGQIYLSLSGQPTLGIIRSPNRAGVACNLDLNGFFLPGTFARNGLPNFPNAFATTNTVLTIMAPASVCAGSPVSVSAPALPGAGQGVTWDFGDPASGAANTATGPAASHTYATGGTYTITLRGSVAGGGLSTVQQTVVANPLPVVRLGARQPLLCPGQVLTLFAPGLPPGATYRWQDGRAAPTYLVSSPGRYRLRVTSSQGCVAQDSVDVVAAPVPELRLVADTLLCDRLQPVVLRPNAQPAGSTFWWSDNSTQDFLAVRQPGTYALEVRSAAGCVARRTVRVRAAQLGECTPVLIPNVITPNGDPANEFFSPKGLAVGEWDLTIHNRWGQLVYQQSRYDQRWNASGQAAGSYYYLLRHPSTGRQFRGWLEVVK